MVGVEQAEGRLEAQALVAQQDGEQQQAPLPGRIGRDSVSQTHRLDFTAIDLDPGGGAGLGEELGGGNPGLLAREDLPAIGNRFQGLEQGDVRHYLTPATPRLNAMALLFYRRGFPARSQHGSQDRGARRWAHAPASRLPV